MIHDGTPILFFGLDHLVVNGGAKADIFTVVPSAGTDFTINGGRTASGDSLNLIETNATATARSRGPWCLRPAARTSRPSPWPWATLTATASSTW